MTAVTGTVSSTTGTGVGSGTAQFLTPNNIFTSNNTYSVAANSLGTSNLATTGFIYALDNGFSIPSGATIDGVAVDIEAKNQLSGTGFRCRPTFSDIFLRYLGADYSASSPAGVSTATWSGTSDTTLTLGGATALWSVSLTPAIINDASFGVRARFQNVNASTQRFSIDNISITVYYTDSGDVQNSQQQFFMYEF